MGQGVMGRFAVISEWLYFLLMVQLLWIAGIIIGVGVFGFFPSTCALFAVVRKRLREGDVRVGQVFWETYKAHFLTSQLPGWAWVFIGIFLYYDIRLLFTYPFLIGFIIAALLVSVLIVYGLSTVWLIPIFFHYELTILNRIRLATMISVIFPHISLGAALTTIVLYFVAKFVPILFMLIGISTAVCLYTKLSMYAFKKIKDRGYIATSKVA